MSKADEIFVKNMKDIMENGVWDTDLPVRPKWSDGTPAHTAVCYTHLTLPTICSV